MKATYHYCLCSSSHPYPHQPFVDHAFVLDTDATENTDESHLSLLSVFILPSVSPSAILWIMRLFWTRMPGNTD